jgi:hypothetical protein
MTAQIVEHLGELVRVNFVGPPIPTSCCVYSAVLDRYEAGEAIGYGPTPEAAIADLVGQIEDQLGPYCYPCRGTGLGKHPDTRCFDCHGRGY